MTKKSKESLNKNNHRRTQGTRPSRGQLKILLLQFRDDPTIKRWEYDSFVHSMKLRPDQVDSLDVLTEEVTNDCIPGGYNGLIIGGNGDTSVYDDIHFRESVESLILHALEFNFPTLMVCYGAQFASLALGGNVERIEEMKETGTHTMYLTEEGMNDPLFKGFPREFSAQLGHNDTITKIPAEAIHLVYSDKVKYQGYRMPGKQFYAIGFHPELDEEQIRARFEYYKDFYADNKEEFKAIMDNISASPYGPELLERFIDYVVLT